MKDTTKAMIGSWIKVFLAAVLSGFLTLVAAQQGLPMSGEAWMGILIAGILALGPVVYNYLDPNDTRYGRGSVDQ